jgi:hypothetical protein
MSAALTTEQAVVPTQMLLTMQILQLIQQSRHTGCEETLEKLERLVSRSIDHNTPRHQKAELQSRYEILFFTDKIVT